MKIWPEYEEVTVKGGILRRTSIPADKVEEYGKTVIRDAAEASRFLQSSYAKKNILKTKK